MENIINFISNIDNSTYNKIRHSKSDAECRRYLKEELTKQLTLTDVVVTLPSVKSKEFKRWTQSKGYEPAFNGLWYEKNNQTYSTDLLYRAFTNEIEFGN